jgi:hypothetical protein
MTDEAREDALSYIARDKGLCLIRLADGSFALARYERTGATLDEIEDYLRSDGSREAEYGREQERRRAEREVLKSQIEWFRRHEQEQADKIRAGERVRGVAQRGVGPASTPSEKYLNPNGGSAGVSSH